MRNFLVTGAMSMMLVACNNGPSVDWDCHRVDVPGGQTVECTGVAAQALTGQQDIVYNCQIVEGNPVCLDPNQPCNCPPTAGVTTDGTGDYGSKTQIGSGVAYGGVGGDTGGGGGTGSGGGATPSVSGGGAGSGGTCANGACYLPECFFGPDITYCPPGSYGGPEDYGTPDQPGNGMGSGTGGNGNGGGNGGTNGNGHGGGSMGGTTTTGGGSTGGGTTTTTPGSGNGGEDYGSTPGWSCTQSGSDVTCSKPPVCGEGLVPSPCGACVPAGSSTVDCVPPKQGGCWFTGGGFVLTADGKDTYGGNGKPMKNGTIQGEWNHVSHPGSDHTHGKVEYLVCRVADGPGPKQPGGKKGLVANQVYFGGHARYRANDVWGDGYWFDAVGEDHGEPGNVKTTGSGQTVKGTEADWYSLTVRLMADPAANQSGTVVYHTEGFFEGGNFQIHPNNNGHPETPSSLPSWVSTVH